jgi:hypothetical protein
VNFARVFWDRSQIKPIIAEQVALSPRNQKSGSLKKLGGVPLHQNGYNGLTRPSIWAEL